MLSERQSQHLPCSHPTRVELFFRIQQRGCRNSFRMRKQQSKSDESGDLATHPLNYAAALLSQLQRSTNRPICRLAAHLRCVVAHLGRFLPRLGPFVFERPLLLCLSPLPRRPAGKRAAPQPAMPEPPFCNAKKLLKIVRRTFTYGWRGRWLWLLVSLPSLGVSSLDLGRTVHRAAPFIFRLSRQLAFECRFIGCSHSARQLASSPRKKKPNRQRSLSAAMQHSG